MRRLATISALLLLMGLALAYPFAVRIAGANISSQGITGKTPRMFEFELPFAGGSGTEEDPYQIENVEQLQAVKDYLDSYFVLIDNIDAYDTINWNEELGFEPIGTLSIPFTGNFDGQGHRIYDLFIERPTTNSVSLFGSISANSVIKNVGMEYVAIFGNYNVSGLVGYNDGGTVSNCYSTGTVGGYTAGGLVGSNVSGGTISNSYSRSPVYGSYDSGGFVGRNDGGTISNCYSTGYVREGIDMGGFIGYGSGAVNNSFWDIETSGMETSFFGGTGKTTEDMKNVRTFTDVSWSDGLDNAWDFVDNPYDDVENENIWNIHSAVNDGYPFLSWQGAPPPAAWELIETWTGMIEAPAVWQLIETWTGIVEAPAEWQLVETWTGTVQAPAPPLLGVKVSISPASKSGLPESTLTYTVTVKNTGTLSDSYTLENTDNAGWALSLSSNSVGPLSGGASGTVTLSVTIPEGAAECTRDNVRVTATSQADNTVESENSCIAHAIAEIRREVEVSISPSENSAENGQNVTFTVTITNTGNVTEDYNLSKTDDAGWTLTLLPTVTDVAPDESTQVTLAVGIPATAENCTRDNVTVTVTSSENTAVDNSASCVAHCLVGAPPPLRDVGVSISPPENEGSPGETVTFTVTVTNTGNVDDTYTLENSDNSGWSLSISPTSLTVPAGENRTATLSIIIPENAAICTRDNIRVRVTSQGDSTVSTESSCIAHAVARGVSRWPSILGILAAIIATAIASALVVRHLRKRRRKKRRRAEARRLRRLKGIIEGEE